MPDFDNPFVGPSLDAEILFGFGSQRGMRSGDEFTFVMGVTENLRNEYESNMERGFTGAVLDFEFDFGFTARGVANDSGGSSRDVAAFLPSTSNPRAFGEQLADGEVPGRGLYTESEFVSDGHAPGTPLPAPPAWVLVLAGLALLRRFGRPSPHATGG